MKTMTIERFTQDLEAMLEAAQHERILVTRDGQPLALVVGLDGKDEEDLRLEESPEFWKMIQERRQQPSVALEDVMDELFGDEKSADDPAKSKEKATSDVHA